MSHIEKNIEIISSQLERFAQKNKDTYNFKCFYCGDSKKSKSKIRGYLYSIGDTFNYRCHNCGKSISFKTFLKDIDSILYERYILEKFKGGRDDTLKLNPIIKKEIKKEKKHFELPLISELDPEHPARVYIEKRKIPKNKVSTLYFSDAFKKWTNSQKPTFTSIKYDEPRIIIPLICDGNIFGFQGRSLSKKSKIKYITIILNDEYPKIYGLDEINWNQNVYILEGPFDSMFISNSIAMVGADINLEEISNKKDIDYIFVYDNEKRNPEIISRMEKTINAGHSIVIWPEDLKEKDVNDMILEDIPVESIIKNNTYKGLQAKVKFYGWKRV